MTALLLCLLMCAGPWDNVQPVAPGPWDSVTVIAEPLPIPAPRPPKILRWEKRCGQNGCEMVPVYEESVDQAAAKLQGWRDLPPAEAKRLADIVDEPERKKARAGHWDAGTCKMLCAIPSHGTHWTWDDPVDDGTPEPTWGSWGSKMQWQPVGLFGRRGYWVTVEAPKPTKVTNK